ncbi:MAG: protein kinase, partial [bacterium]
MTDVRDQLQAALGDAYEIERELGGGGMSRVFVAVEQALGRRVVVKILPADLAGSVSVARFRREISVAARLQHPHIVPLLAAGEVGGLPYFVMPFVDGESLRDRLSHGELPIAEVISVLRDVARALAFAHANGVTHRDIKPDNVLISGASAVIADFGVAKAVSDATVAGPLTSIGVALGTPAYMAPEQAAADPSVDLRADFYAFGVMAYEMLAGHVPFAGRSTQGMLAANAIEPPTSIATLRPATPAPLADVVMRCLAKRPGDRPQGASEIIHVLDGIGASTGAPAASVSASRLPLRTSRRRVVGAAVVIVGLLASAMWWRTKANDAGRSDVRSIAVLPFTNTSGDTAFDYLEDGVTDQVRDALHTTPDLVIKARGSSQQMKGRSPKEIGSKLGVDAVLQGSVSGSLSHLHVTAELVHAADESVLWSKTFDGTPNELVGMQDTIVRAIAGRLHVASIVNTDRTGAGRPRGTADAVAYDFFLRGRHPFDQNDFATAIDLFRKAVAQDPQFARAHAYLAMSYANLPTLGVAPADSMNALARASITRAVTLDSTVPEAYAAEAFVLTGELRFADAISPLEKAVRLDSTNADVGSAYSAALGQLGRVTDGLVQARRARASDPLSGTAIALLSYALFLSRQYDAAIDQMRVATQLDPSNPIMHRALGFYHVFHAQPDSAVLEFERGFKLGPTHFGGRSNLVFGYAAAGRWGDASRERALIEREAGGNSPNY